MARFLFVVPPFAGHVNPTIPLAAELERRGHAVAWTGLPRAVPALLPRDAPFLPSAPEAAADAMDEIAHRAPSLRGAAALKFLMEDVLFPLARVMIPGVDAAVDAFGADVLVVDQQALGGAVVGRRRRMPWATSATTSAELVDPLAALPAVGAAMHDQRVALQVEAGIDPEVAAEGDLRVSPHLVLAFTSAALAGPDAARLGPVVFVGPSVAGRPEDDRGFPWERLDPDRPAVLVTLGTLNADAGERFFGEAAEAARDQQWQVVFAAPPELVPGAPPDAIVRAWVPQLALLDRLAAVVCHGGHNTVCESLAAAVPLVVAPIRDDQPVIAAQVVDAGAGVRVKFSRVRAPELRAAVERALTDADLRAGARRVQQSFAAAGGTPAAADHLERLACG